MLVYITRIARSL